MRRPARRIAALLSALLLAAALAGCSGPAGAPPAGGPIPGSRPADSLPGAQPPATPVTARPRGPAKAPAAETPTAETRLRAVAVGVDDGDSFAVRRADGTRLRIRIAGIDAPERSQPWAGVARKHLQTLLVGKTVQLRLLKTDRWQRQVAVVEAGGRDVGLAMLEAGLAWHYAQYDRDLPAPLRATYARAAGEARDRRAGLWAGDAPEPPWTFRRRNRR